MQQMKSKVFYWKVTCWRLLMASMTHLRAYHFMRLEGSAE